MNTYEIAPRSEDIGGGWRLSLLEGGEEVGGGVFDDYEDALAEAEDWVSWDRSAA